MKTQINNNLNFQKDALVELNCNQMRGIDSGALDQKTVIVCTFTTDTIIDTCFPTPQEF